MKTLSKERIGKQNQNNQGLTMTILNYIGAKNIDVIFEDGYISKNKEYKSFLIGEILNPNYLKLTRIKDRTGETSINCQNLKMEIINYVSSTDIDIEFEDGYIIKHTTYASFKNKKIMSKKFENNIKHAKFIGEVNYNSDGCLMKIIEYRSCHDIDVQFDKTGYIYHNGDYRIFKLGNIKDPYNKNLHNVGFFGEGEYTLSNPHHLNIYTCWKGILNRCYNPDRKNTKFEFYEGCSVCDEWHNFQNFASWYDDNIYIVENEKVNIDKDILYENNKIYSPQTCMFIPQYINNLISRKKSLNSCKTKSGKFFLEITTRGKTNRIGIYNNIEDLRQKYIEEKHKQFINIINEYSNKLPTDIYEILLNFDVSRLIIN